MYRRIFGNFTFKLASDAGRLLLQTGYYILLARYLEQDQYGDFSVIVALTTFAIPFVMMGLPYVMALETANDRKRYEDYLGSIYVTIVALSVLATAVFGLLSPHIQVLSKPGLLEFALILICSSLLTEGQRQTLTCLYQSVDRLMVPSALAFVQVLLRFAFITALLVGGTPPNLGLWIAGYLVCDWTTAALFFIISWRDGFRRTGWNPRIIRKSLRLGITFGISTAARTMYTDLDKVLVSNLLGSVTAAIYAVGFRIASIAGLPAAAYLAALYPEQVRTGTKGPEALVRRSFTLGLPALVVGTVSALLIYLVAPLVIPMFFGIRYEESTAVVRLLAVTVFVQAVSFLAGDILTCTGFQPWRTAIELGGFALNAVLALQWIPLWGWQGAAYASIANQTGICLAYFVAILVSLRREARSRGQMAPYV